LKLTDEESDQLSSFLFLFLSVVILIWHE